ncbi:Uncharacterised protein [Amycolatopsis camponoti]|uniref:Uncharacterized protein n=1 Tax=Amycolatopsis camponoti TaxID=2606593 RepID=A0A6I8LTZ7_9PSEU|nr:Uncharacterised protein [Amycolatopsis camponoti]
MTITAVGPEVAWSVLGGGILALARTIVWLIGLTLAIRGSRTADRPAVLRAYLSRRRCGECRRTGRPHRC